MRFTSGFQALVNTYGTPRYREANPGAFAVILFPFLFGTVAYNVLHEGRIMLKVLLRGTDKPPELTLKDIRVRRRPPPRLAVPVGRVARGEHRGRHVPRLHMVGPKLVRGARQARDAGGAIVEPCPEGTVGCTTLHVHVSDRREALIVQALGLSPQSAYNGTTAGLA